MLQELYKIAKIENIIVDPSFLKDICDKHYFINTYRNTDFVNEFIQFTKDFNVKRLKSALVVIDQYFDSGLISEVLRDFYYAELDWNLAQSNIPRKNYISRDDCINQLKLERLSNKALN
jgi:hypothetical protein